MADADTAARAFLTSLDLPESAVPLVAAAKRARAGTPLQAVFAKVAEPTGSGPSAARRRRVAGLIVGEIAEREFKRRYSRKMRGQEFTLVDQRSSANETDFLVLNGKERPAFRINIKAHGTFFLEAMRFVGLAPEDTFALATYKIKDANRRSSAEALPFLFAVVSSADLAMGPVARRLPPEVAHLFDVSTMFKGIKGLRALENAAVERVISGRYARRKVIGDLQQAVRAANWRVISAVKAEHLMNELMWERVPAVAQRNFSGSAESQPNMHFSLNQDMLPLDDLLDLLRDHGIQHVATKIAYHQL